MKRIVHFFPLFLYWLASLCIIIAHRGSLTTFASVVFLIMLGMRRTGRQNHRPGYRHAHPHHAMPCPAGHTGNRRMARFHETAAKHPDMCRIRLGIPANRHAARAHPADPVLSLGHPGKRPRLPVYTPVRPPAARLTCPDAHGAAPEKPPRESARTRGASRH